MHSISLSDKALLTPIFLKKNTNKSVKSTFLDIEVLNVSLCFKFRSGRELQSIGCEMINHIPAKG